MAASEATIHVGFDKTTAEAIAALRESADRLAALITDMPDHDPTLRAHEDRITKAEKELTRAFTAINEDHELVKQAIADVAKDADGRIDVLQEMVHSLSKRISDVALESDDQIRQLISDNYDEHGNLTRAYEARRMDADEQWKAIRALQEFRQGAGPVPTELSEDEFDRLYDRMTMVVNQFASPLRRSAQRNTLDCKQLDVAVANLHTEIRKSIEHLDPNRVPF